MATSDKNNVTTRVDIGRALSFQEGDNNFEELKRVIDDALSNEEAITELDESKLDKTGSGNEIKVTSESGTDQSLPAALNRRGVKFTALRAPTSGTFDPENYLETATKVTEGLDCYTLGYYAPVFPSNKPFSGGNNYRLFATGGADDGGSWIELGGSGLKAQGLFTDSVCVDQFGADSTGANLCHANINNAISFLNLRGSGSLEFSAGTYLLGNSNPLADNWDNRVAIWVKTDNIEIKGKGVGVTKLKLADNEGAHVIKVGQVVGGQISCKRVHISGLSIDGNRGNQIIPNATDNHWNGISVSEGCEKVKIKEIETHDCTYYGINFQRGGFKDCLVDTVYVERTGADGIDCKGEDGTNRGNVMRNVRVKNHGLVSSLFLQAGVEVRGGWSLSDIVVTDVSSDRHGIRINREQDVINAQESSLHSFFVAGGASATGNVGVYLNSSPNAKNVRVSKGKASNFDIGVDSRATGTKILDCLSELCNTGLIVNGASNITNFDSQNCTDGILVNGNSNTFSGLFASNCSTGLRVSAGSSFTSVKGGLFENNANKVVDDGVSTGIEGVVGIRTASSGTASVDVTTTGTKLITVAHNLDFAPDLKNITISLIRETQVGDYVIGFISLVNADLQNVYVNVRVTTASSTPSATVGLNIQAIAKKSERW